MNAAVTADVTAAGEPVPTLERLNPQAVHLPGGVQLHHATAGAGAPLVFIHGAMGDWRAWAPQWDAFTARYRCTSYSRRYSHPNRNDMPSPDHSALIEADDLAALLDAMGTPRAILVGSSYGAFTALALAVAQPQRVAAVVAVEPAMLCYADFSEAGRAERARFRAQTIEPANAAFRRGEDALAAQLMTGGINGAASPVNQGPAYERRLQNVRAMRMLALSSDEFPLLPPQALAALPMPVLLVSGQRTPAIHAHTFANVAAAMPQAEVQRVADAGHGVARDQPAVFNALALDFLARHRAAIEARLS
ncbi:alpha/beta hydrolase [Ideonella sp. DXS22W]|uniref:Alpha/beta hydrolase n=1 Tax=Pseudaquabacterium inlustre TaxID=2984192 RepID=A0ABU9CGP2_9BURK